MITITIYVAINECGDFELDGCDAADAITNLRDNAGFEAVRVVKVDLLVEPPELEIVNIAVTAPAQSQAPAVVTVS